MPRYEYIPNQPAEGARIVKNNPYQGGMPTNDMPPQLLNDNLGPPIGAPIHPSYDPYAGNMPYNDVISAPRERLTPPGGMPYPGGGTGTKAGGQGLGGQGPMPQMTPLEQINQLYQSQLGREADEGGRNYWLQQLQGGMSPDQIRQTFANSQEGQDYQKRRSVFTDDMGAGMGYPSGGNGTKAGGGAPQPLPDPSYPGHSLGYRPMGGGSGTKAGGVGGSVPSPNIPGGPGPNPSYPFAGGGGGNYGGGALGNYGSGTKAGGIGG